MHWKPVVYGGILTFFFKNSTGQELIFCPILSEEYHNHLNPLAVKSGLKLFSFQASLSLTLH